MRLNSLTVFHQFQWKQHAYMTMYEKCNSYPFNHHNLYNIIIYRPHVTYNGVTCTFTHPGWN